MVRGCIRADPDCFDGVQLMDMRQIVTDEIEHRGELRVLLHFQTMPRDLRWFRNIWERRR